jgi:hypothetical protein
LHVEAKILKVNQHINLLASQFLANALKPDHSSHGVVTLLPGPRNKKNTLHSKNIETVKRHLRDRTIPPTSFKKVINSLHTSADLAACRAFAPNKLLGQHPPDINPEEETLSRPYRCTLSQLRSDECHRLKDYLHKIGKAADDICPECGVASQTVRHLFKCPAFPTNLTIYDVWTHPPDAAIFISGLPSFAHYLPLVAPFSLLLSLRSHLLDFSTLLD